MKTETMNLISRLLEHVLINEENHYQETLYWHPKESPQVQNHAYTLALAIADELKIRL
jgi:hypothetical protein